MTTKKPQWFQMSTEGKQVPEVWIYGEIGDWWDDNDAKTFSENWQALGDPDEVLIRIHSIGGSIIDGLAIYNTIKNSRATVTTQVDGLAASMGSVIALAGDIRRASTEVLFMVHQPWGVAVGEAEDMRKHAETLDKMNDIAVGIYQERTGLDESTIRDMLAEETWLTGQEAFDMGFLTELQHSQKLAACGEKGVFTAAIKNHKRLQPAAKSRSDKSTHSKGSHHMAKPQESGEGLLSLSQADLDAQLTAAKEEGHRAGLESLEAKLAEKETEAKASGADVERERIGAILGSEEAKGRQDLAHALAFPEEGDLLMNADQAIKMLGRLAKSEPQRQDTTAVDTSLANHLSAQTDGLESEGSEELSDFQKRRLSLRQARGKS